MNEKKMWIAIVVICFAWLFLVSLLVGNDEQEKEKIVNMEMTIAELSQELEQIKHNAAIEERQESSLYAEGMMVKIDEKGNKILFVNPKGRIEMFCDGFYVNGERVER